MLPPLPLVVRLWGRSRRRRILVPPLPLAAERPCPCLRRCVPIRGGVVRGVRVRGGVVAGLLLELGLLRLRRVVLRLVLVGRGREGGVVFLPSRLQAPGGKNDIKRARSGLAGSTEDEKP